jgi:hypothetical protein
MELMPGNYRADGAAVGINFFMRCVQDVSSINVVDNGDGTMTISGIHSWFVNPGINILYDASNSEVGIKNSSYTVPRGIYTLWFQDGFPSNVWQSLLINPPAVATYTLTVNSGTGSGSYSTGTVVSISANTAPSGQEFDKWTGDVSGVANVNNANTTYTMGSVNATITATYKTSPTPTYTLTVNSGTGSGNYASGATVNISAGTPPAGEQFKNWTSSSSVTFDDANSSSTSFTMPASAVTVTANFEPIPATTYTVTVLGGSGSGSYVAGATVSISASPPAGQQFKNWTTSSAGVSFADPNNANTSFTMPANAVTVTAVFESIPAVPVTGVTLQTTLIKTVGDAAVTLVATVSPANATNKTVTWSTSNPNVVNVATNGTLSFVGVGKAIITVTTVNGGKTASCEVMSNPKVASMTFTEIDSNTFQVEVIGNKKTIFNQATLTVYVDGVLKEGPIILPALTYTQNLSIQTGWMEIVVVAKDGTRLTGWYKK